MPANEQFTAKDADTGIQPSIDADTGTLLAPNRYDGMDLADNACRMMLMAGLPTVSHLQDRFLETKLRASAVLHERIRTRVLQGAGRCTRGPKDWAVVVVTGDTNVNATTTPAITVTHRNVTSRSETWFDVPTAPSCLVAMVIADSPASDAPSPAAPVPR